MHGSVKLGDQVLRGGDAAPDRYEEPRGFALSLQIMRYVHTLTHLLQANFRRGGAGGRTGGAGGRGN